MAAKAKGPTVATCGLVDARDQYQCVRCGVNLLGLSASRHHRQLRRFGDHSAANLILLCGSGTTGCHGWVHANPLKACADGWMLKSWQKVEEEPVLYADGSRHRLTLEGGKIPA